MTNKKEEKTAEMQITKLTGFDSIEEMTGWANTLIEGGFLPDAISLPEQVISIVELGKELGLSPLVSLNNLHVIAGRPVISSSMLGALLKKTNVEWIIEEDFATVDASGGGQDKRTTYKFFWKSRVDGRVMETTHSITWRQMEISGYTTKHNWLKYPKEMMRARCLSSAVRALFPNILMGMYSDLEINDIAAQEGFEELEITVDEAGEIKLT